MLLPVSCHLKYVISMHKYRPHVLAHLRPGTKPAGDTCAHIHGRTPAQTGAHIHPCIHTCAYTCREMQMSSQHRKSFIAGDWLMPAVVQAAGESGVCRAATGCKVRS